MKVSTIFLLAFLPLQAQAQNSGGDVRIGEKLYYDFGCYGCHGYNATMRVPLAGDASAVMQDDALFLAYLRLRADQNPVNPKNTMPNYADRTLSDAQALDIYAYIRSVKDDPAEIADEPIMQKILDAAKAGDRQTEDRTERHASGESQ